MRLTRWVLLFVLGTGLSGGALALIQDKDAPELLKTADEMIQKVTELRSLQPRNPISKGVKNREEISVYLNERIQEDYGRSELEKEGRMLQKLGLIPASVDYRSFLVNLLSEQVGGFYDLKKKSFYIASWLPAEEQRPVMVHEITHALQDQHFNVYRILKEDRELHNDDRTLAHQAVMEGDGMVVMLQYIIGPEKRHFSQLPDLAFILRATMSTAQSQYPVFKNAPAFIQEILLFPYGYGASFLQKAWNRSPSWEFINGIYSDLPASTEQIIHAEKYFSDRDNPKPVRAIDPAAQLGGTWKAGYRNVLGEFSLGLLLGLQLPEERARRSAAGWGGDQVLLLEDASGKDAVFVNTVWDTPEEAEKFFLAMQEWFQGRYPNARRSDEGALGFSLVQDREFHAMRRDGANIYFIIGLPEADRQAWASFK